MHYYTKPMRYYAIDGDAKLHILGTFSGELGCDEAAEVAEEMTGGYFTVIDQNEMDHWVNTYLNDMRNRK